MKFRLAAVVAGCLCLLSGCMTALDNKCNYLPSNRCCPIAHFELNHCGRCICKGDTCTNCWSCGYYYNFHDE